jgi:hypothetical protein
MLLLLRQNPSVQALSFLCPRLSFSSSRYPGVWLPASLQLRWLFLKIRNRDFDQES